MGGKSLRQFLITGENDAAACTVTGRLCRIDFDARKITIEYPTIQRELECFYNESVEDLLLEKPREFIQVTGRIILDENDNPKQIVDVEDICEVDLSSFHIEQFECDGHTLRFRSPLTLEPELDESKQLLCVRHPDFGIDAHAYTRGELDDVIRDQIDVLWRNYALAHNETLTPEAQRLKENLMNALEEIPSAESET
ncbi:MAG: hypothetical protein ABIH23_17170 [bacterium]